jgi:hypothetical protein
MGLLAAIAAVGLSAAPALAAFPGGNGELAVQPVTGGGVDLVSPTTGTAHEVCSDVTLCGTPTDPHFSPNGRALVFTDAASHRIVVTDSGGSCLWCLLGTPLTSVTGSGAAFGSAGAALTVSSAGGVSKVSLSGARAQRLLRGFASVTWSAAGRVAATRAGRVWVSEPHSARLGALTPGATPDWAPNGRALAIVRHGWVWRVPLTPTRRDPARRLVRGSAPAWSPNGRTIAYIAAGGAVSLIPAGGGRARALGSVHGVSVAWQPLPRASTPSCSPGKHSAIDSDADAVVYQSGSAAYGCLRALSHRVSLGTDLGDDGEGDGVDLSVDAMSGRFAVVDRYTYNHYDQCTNVLDLVDLSNAATTALPSNDECDGYGTDAYGIALPGRPLLDSSGFTAWLASTESAGVQPLNGVSCPTSAFCAIADGDGGVLTSTAPGSGAWSGADADPGQALDAIACPSDSLCVAGAGDGNVASTSDPAAGDWSVAHVDQQEDGGATIEAIACPSATLCVAGDSAGDIVTSTDPTGGASTWTTSSTLLHLSVAVPIPFVVIDGISCTNSSLCVAVGARGAAFVSSDPTGGAGAWTSETIASDTDTISGISCPTVGFCAAVDSGGHVLTTTDPTGGASAWSSATIASDALQAIDCPSAGFCVAIDAKGTAWTSTDPTGGVDAWTPASADPGATVSAVACPTVSLCVAADRGGAVATTTSPATTAPWDHTPLEVLPCSTSSGGCVWQTLVVRDDAGTRIVASTPVGTAAIAGLTLSGDSTVLGWTDDGAPESLTLR